MEMMTVEYQSPLVAADVIIACLGLEDEACLTVYIYCKGLRRVVFTVSVKLSLYFYI